METLNSGVANQRIKELEAQVIRLKDQLRNVGENNERFIAELSEGFASNNIGDDFFNALVKYIFEKTRVDYVLVGKLVNNSDGLRIIRTLALNAFGKQVDNMDYPFMEGPCGQVIAGQLYVYPRHARQFFPNNPMLAALEAEAYIGYPLYNADGVTIGLIAVMHKKELSDVNYLSSLLKIVAKRAELELERVQYQEILEQKTKSLEEANNNLELSNKNLEQFAYMASHDLQEPLRKIITFSNLIRERSAGKLDPVVQPYFERIITSADRMRQLITDLLDYSRLQQITGAFVATDLNTIFKSVQNDFEILIEEKEAVIDCRQLPVVEAIPMQMNQLFTNLFSNFLKFSKSGETPVLKVSHRVLTPEEVSQHSSLNPLLTYYQICFRDNGIGFSQKFAEKIFIIFQRLNGRSEYPGTGIGLAICKKIATFHQGEIYAQAVENEGATFYVLLPAHQKAEVPKAT
ncbi:sensor histidine kinase [Segetibacter sp. 3557_3]|uniref:GAF domain-containing sensor histidine kinase n=1 Tax=Segetibacter sp. 3557_3 TaxID=2547429 RepID=UPI0010588FBF|nr:ATP-binding protein [Segetibacter sp. 3557_3]TDH18376.1 sensor histidine kinase [Segetibacter sp. 3557_3]